MYYIIGILLGLIPEVLYLTLMFIKIKKFNDIKKNFLYFTLISSAYMLCICIQQYVFLFYFIFILLIYIISKIIYKNRVQILDFLVINFILLYLTIISFLCFVLFKKDLSNYWIMYTIDRILIFVPFLFIDKIRKVYKKYCKFWNRNDSEKRLIKSITLRNISLIVINFAMCFMNAYATKIINFLK